MSDKVFVTGDWEWNDTLDAFETAYETVKVGPPWNGFATPVVAQDVMTALIGRQMMLDPAFDAQRFAWDGDGVVVKDADPDVADFWLMPDADGHFDLEPLGWTWQIVTEDDNVIRKVTTDAFNPRAEAVAAGTVLGQFEDHKDDCEFSVGTSATCTC